MVSIIEPAHSSKLNFHIYSGVPRLVARSVAARGQGADLGAAGSRMLSL